MSDLGKTRDSKDRDRQATLPKPTTRLMTVIAQDPSVRVGSGRSPILMARISVPAETMLPGPIGYRTHLIDYDAAVQRFNGIYNLPERYEDEPSKWKTGDPSLINDYRFHAQNVYALVMKTLSRFEFALGRRISWKFGTHQLKIAPHGMLDANAFYSPRDEGLVFGYFSGRGGRNIYTCLSHDIVVHETTHALIDALRERYLDPSSPDQAAFHEGLADVIALLSVFTQSELVQKLLQGNKRKQGSPKLISRKDISVESLRKSTLFGLADEMGEELNGVRGYALRRSTEIALDPRLLSTTEFLEPHRRGEILVAAVMDAFIHVWAQRILDSGITGQRNFPIPRVSEEGADIAEAILTVLIRAIDYMPPVHLEFPDVLSAALTADFEVRPDDSRYQLRKRMLESFNSFGIKPASLFNDPKGIWDPAPAGLRYDRVRFESMRTDKDEIFRFMWDNFDQLRLRRGAYTEVLSVRPCKRLGTHGFVLHETVAEYYQVARLTLQELKSLKIRVPKGYVAEILRQQQKRKSDGSVRENEEELQATTPVYGGGTLIFDEYGKLKYHIKNDVFGSDRQSERLRYLWQAGLLEVGKDEARLQIRRLSTIHRLRAIDARRFPTEGW